MRRDISQMSAIIHQIRSPTYLRRLRMESERRSWHRSLVWLSLAAGVASSCLSNYPSRRPLLCSTFFLPCHHGVSVYIYSTFSLIYYCFYYDQSWKIYTFVICTKIACPTRRMIPIFGIPENVIVSLCFKFIV